MGTNEATVFYEDLMKHIATCSMASEVLGIKQKNLCRYKKELQEKKLLFVIYFRPCETGHMAQWLTCNPDIVPTASKTQKSFQIGGCNE